MVAERVEDGPVADASYLAGVRNAAETLDARVLPECGGARTSEVVATERLRASDPALSDIAAGADVVLRERVAVAACGETRLHAVYAGPHPMGGWRFETGAPGGSIASLELQREVIAQVGAQAAGIIASGFPEGACDGAANAPWVLDTALHERPRKGRWSERWTLAACGVRRTITVSFEETPTGARFAAPIALAEE